MSSFAMNLLTPGLTSSAISAVISDTTPGMRWYSSMMSFLVEGWAFGQMMSGGTTSKTPLGDLVQQLGANGGDIVGLMPIILVIISWPIGGVIRELFEKTGKDIFYYLPNCPPELHVFNAVATGFICCGLWFIPLMVAGFICFFGYLVCPAVNKTSSSVAALGFLVSN
jgi:hypothetical protein